MPLLIIHYLRWHYTRALRDIFNILGNFLWFCTEFFSMRLLVRTLFVPFQRIEEHAGTGFDAGAILQAFIITTLMRFVGAFLRLLVLLVGLVALVLVALTGLVMFVFWLASPVVVVFMLGIGLVFLST